MPISKIKNIQGTANNYEQAEIQKVLDNEDVTEYRLKINDTKWLNVTREELFGIQKILGDKL